MSDYIYVALPFIAWIVSGTIKFVVNYIRFGNKAKQLIGYGGFPSTHSTVLSAPVFLCGFTEGFNTPLFSLGVGALLILVIDAHGLRRKVGEQAASINELRKVVDINAEPLRERMGHSWYEISGGIVLGAVIGYFVTFL